MKPALRFAEFQPTDDPQCVWVDLSVGPAGEDGGDLFHIFVCTPDWLAMEVERNGARWGRSMLIVQRIHPDEILREIESRLSKTSADTWPDLAHKISRTAEWEFDEYVEQTR